MRNLDDVRELFSHGKYLYDNGDQLTGSIYNKALLTGVFIGLFRDFFEGFGLPIWILCAAGIFPIVTGNIIIGYMNLRYGILRQYNNQGWYNCDVAMDLVDDARAVYEHVVPEDLKKTRRLRANGRRPDQR